MKLPSTKASTDLNYEAIVKLNMWVLVPWHVDTNIIACRCTFTLKYNPNETIHHHKSQLLVGGFIQMYNVEYKKTFFLVVHVNSISIILTLVVNRGWSLYQLDDSNAFFMLTSLTNCSWRNPLDVSFMRRSSRYVTFIMQFMV